MVDRHVMIITHVSFVPHSSYETYETYVRNVTYAALMEGDPRITFVSVGWTSASGEDMTISLDRLQKHCRPERVEDLIEDLTVLCEGPIGPTIDRYREQLRFVARPRRTDRANYRSPVTPSFCRSATDATEAALVSNAWCAGGGERRSTSSEARAMQATTSGDNKLANSALVTTRPPRW